MFHAGDLVISKVQCNRRLNVIIERVVHRSVLDVFQPSLLKEFGGLLLCSLWRVDDLAVELVRAFVSLSWWFENWPNRVGVDAFIESRDLVDGTCGSRASMPDRLLHILG